tara:strand:+ start:658 stop:807 length:150 start_codon:yes stop_codon:yes gene_type:complete
MHHEGVLRLKCHVVLSEQVIVVVLSVEHWRMVSLHLLMLFAQAVLEVRS